MKNKKGNLNRFVARSADKFKQFFTKTSKTSQGLAATRKSLNRMSVRKLRNVAKMHARNYLGITDTIRFNLRIKVGVRMPKNPKFIHDMREQRYLLGSTKNELVNDIMKSKTMMRKFGVPLSGGTQEINWDELDDISFNYWLSEWRTKFIDTAGLVNSDGTEMTRDELRSFFDEQILQGNIKTKTGTGYKKIRLKFLNDVAKYDQ